MFENQNAGRRGSFGSMATVEPEDIVGFDLDTLKLDDADNTPIAPSSPLRESQPNEPPRRERFGTCMTIVATTSPEIKALNLPTTPSFPATRLDFTRSNSFSCSPQKASLITPQSALASRRAQSMRERVAFCIDTMDDVVCAASFKSPPSSEERQTASDPFYHDVDEEEVDDLLRSICPTIVPYHPDENKENIHPNLIEQKPEKTTLALDIYDDDLSVVKKKSRHERRKSFHRRISCESLPSAAEIGASPLPTGSQTSRRRNAQKISEVVEFALPSLEEPVAPNCQPNLPSSMRMQSKRLQLRTGFR